MMRQVTILILMLALVPCHAQHKNQLDILPSEKLIRVADSVTALMAEFHYNPLELSSEEYLNLDEEVHRLAKNAQSKQEFVDKFNKLWTDGPFSHVSLQASNMKAEAMAAYFDNMRVGDQGVSLDWEDKTAVLTVNTMMGIDTYERIFDMYREIEAKQAKVLIIDVRNNPGGTFAIVPLVGHLLTESIDAGVFVSRKWWKNHTEPPVTGEIQGQQGWEGWSLTSFWADVQKQALLRIKFKPMNPYYAGPVYVLTSSRSASATEFAVDAMAHLNQVIIVGEATAGQMLSQKMYDLPYGFQLSLPIAEYYSARIGRIEGNGVQPDVVVDEKLAKQVVDYIIQGETREKAIEKARITNSN